MRLPNGAAGLLILALVAALAALAPALPLKDPVGVAVEWQFEPPGHDFVLGADSLGRDVLARLVWGARSSLVVGVLSVAVGFAGGTLAGLLAGYNAGTVKETVLLRILDVFASIPLLVWAIAVIGIFGAGGVKVGPLMLSAPVKLVLLIGMLFIPGLARVAHGLTLAEVRSDYVDARRLQDASPGAIMFGDILPNILPAMLVQASVLVGVGILIEASLSFIGLGIQPPAPSWGGMLADAKQSVFSDEWWLPVFPGLAIFVTVIGFNLVGDALRTVLDPRRRTGLRTGAAL